MTPNEYLQRHAQVPVCRTFHGCREHVRHLSLRQRWELEFHLGCTTEQLARRIFHAATKGADHGATKEK